MIYYICDDNIIFAKELEKKIHTIQPECKTKLFTTLAELEATLRNGTKPNAVFLDIMNADGNGIQFAETLHKLDPMTKLVFVTSHAEEFYQDIFRCPPGSEPAAYLSKPVQEKYLRNALEKIIISSNETQALISVNINHQTKYIRCEEIIYISSNLRQLDIITENEKLVCYGKMDEIQRRLPGYFCQCHRSHIINIRKIQRVNNWTSIEMKNGTQIPIGKVYLNAAKQAVSSEYSFMGGSLRD